MRTEMLDHKTDEVRYKFLMETIADRLIVRSSSEGLEKTLKEFSKDVQSAIENHPNCPRHWQEENPADGKENDVVIGILAEHLIRAEIRCPSIDIPDLLSDLVDYLREELLSHPDRK